MAKILWSAPIGIAAYLLFTLCGVNSWLGMTGVGALCIGLNWLGYLQGLIERD